METELYPAGLSTGAAEALPSAGPASQHARRSLAVLLAGLFMGNIDNAIVNIAIPSIRHDLGASGGAIELVVSGYTLAYAMLLITGARVGDVRGYGRAFRAGLALFTLASLACGLAPDAAVLIASRIIQGMGAAFMIPQVLSSIQLGYTGRERARALGLYSATLSGGAVAGQVLGGLIVSANILGAGWRPVFLINVPIGLALLVAAARTLPPDLRGTRKPLDMTGMAVLCVTVLLAILPLELGGDLGWPVWGWVLLAASIPAGTVFILLEKKLQARGGYPLFNAGMLARPGVAWGLGAQAAATATYFSLLFTLALFLQQGLGRSPLYSGLALVSWVSAFGIAGYLLQKLPQRVSSRAAPWGYLLLAVSYAGLSASLFSGIDGGPLIICVLGLGGFGLGIGFSSLIAHLTAIVPARHAPDLSGIVTTTTQVAAVMGVAGFGTLYLGLLAAQRAAPPDAGGVLRCFAITDLALCAAALCAAFAAHRSFRTS